MISDKKWVTMEWTMEECSCTRFEFQEIIYFKSECGYNYWFFMKPLLRRYIRVDRQGVYSKVGNERMLYATMTYTRYGSSRELMRSCLIMLDPD